jgi:hypothetical protein
MGYCFLGLKTAMVYLINFSAKKNNTLKTKIKQKCFSTKVEERGVGQKIVSKVKKKRSRSAIRKFGSLYGHRVDVDGRWNEITREIFFSLGGQDDQVGIRRCSPNLSTKKRACVSPVVFHFKQKLVTVYFLKGHVYFSSDSLNTMALTTNTGIVENSGLAIIVSCAKRSGAIRVVSIENLHLLDLKFVVEVDLIEALKIIFNTSPVVRLFWAEVQEFKAPLKAIFQLDLDSCLKVPAGICFPKNMAIVYILRGYHRVEKR